MRLIHWSPVNSPHKGQWRGALMSTLICAWTNGWVNNGEDGDLRRHLAHYDVRHCNGTFGRFGQEGQITRTRFFFIIQMLWKIGLLLHFKVSYRCKILHLPRQTSVVPCAQFHTSDFITTWLKTERNFHLNCDVNRSWNGPRANKGSGHSLIFLHPFVINLSLIRSNLHDL